MTKHEEVYATPYHTKKVFANMKRSGKGFFGRVTPLFLTMMIQASEDMEKFLDLEKAKIAQEKEIASLKKRVKKMEKRRKLRTPWIKRLRKIGSTSMVESSNDVSLGDQNDASKQRRKIEDLDADVKMTLVDETQEINDDNLMFYIGVLEEQEKEVAKKEVSAA
ncbi:hypothetical protein Tco_0142124, partial [Tanacetum coccineum]